MLLLRMMWLVVCGVVVVGIGSGVVEGRGDFSQLQMCTGCQLMVSHLLEEISEGGEVEGSVRSLCGRMGGGVYASVGSGDGAKFVPFAGFLAGHSYDNLSVGNTVDDQVEAVCDMLWDSQTQDMVLARLLGVGRVYDADLSPVCRPSCAPTMARLSGPS